MTTTLDTPTISPRAEALRARIQQLPPEAQGELRSRWPRGVSLLDPAVADTALDTVERLVAGYETPAATPEQVADQVDADRRAATQRAVDELRSIVAGLPDDLAAQLKQQIKEAGIPDSLFDATDTQIARTSMLVGDAATVADRRRILAVTRCTQVGLSDTDRHNLIEEATGGATNSARRLTGDQLRQVLDVCARRELGADWQAAIDWKQAAVARGTSQAQLLRTAQTAAAELGIDQPRRLADLPAGLAHAWFTDGATPAAAGPAGDPPVEQPAAPVIDPVLVVVHTPAGLVVHHVTADRYARLQEVLA